MDIAAQKKLFTRTLFRWHKTHYRDMPWRNTRDPYAILVSEIMLQQTQVERVRGKYDAFLKKFPTVHHLARAPLGDVLRMWSGLGYNRRAKYLHECAKEVERTHGGKFPNDFDTLMTLSGIGRSTAAALGAFAFGKDEPMIDTNIRRILVRVFFTPKLSRFNLDKNDGVIEVGQNGRKECQKEEWEGKKKEKKLKGVLPSDKELFAFAKTLIPRGRGRMWNYAMLDVGATECTARNHSAKCPLAALHGEVDDFVYKKPQKKFAHSNRFYRGRILATLTREGSTTKQKLSKTLLLDPSVVSTLIQKLKEEKMIVLRGQKLTLP